jgi:hypothetical protein
MLHTPEQLHKGMIREGGISGNLVLGTVIMGDFLVCFSGDPISFCDGALEALKRWNDWVKPAREFLRDYRTCGKAGRGAELITSAYFAGLQSWLDILAAYDITVSNPADLKAWCKLQHVILARYRSAYEVGPVGPTIQVGDEQIHLVTEALSLLDSLLDDDEKQQRCGLERLKKIRDGLRFPPGRVKAAELPPQSLCEAMIRLAWKYMRSLGDVTLPEPMEVRNTIEARAHLDEVVIWCNQEAGGSFRQHGESGDSMRRTAGDQRAESRGNSQPNQRAAVTVNPVQALDIWQDLREFAASHLRGVERRVVELVINGNGTCRINVIASDGAVGWENPGDNFNSTKSRLNPKLKKIGYTLYRHDNEARLKCIGRK